MIRETSRVAGLSSLWPVQRRETSPLHSPDGWITSRGWIPGHRLGRRFIGLCRACTRARELLGNWANQFFFLRTFNFVTRTRFANVKVGAFASYVLRVIASGIVVNNNKELAAWTQLERQLLAGLKSTLASFMRNFAVRWSYTELVDFEL